MKGIPGKIVFIDSNKYSFFFVEANRYYGYLLTIGIKSDTRLEYDIILQRLQKALNSATARTDDPKQKEVLQQLQGQEQQLIDDAKCVEFKCSIKDVINHIQVNPCLKDKKVIINEQDDLDVTKIQELKTMFGDNTSNLHFYLQYDAALTSCEKCLAIFNKVESITQHILQLELSPIEQAMYAYDMVRSKVYHVAEPGQVKSASTDLLADDVAWTGYANVFRAILNRLGIKSRLCQLNCDGKYYVRNEAYIQDQKYCIDGVYYFDTILDSKKENNNNSYLSSYCYFAKTKVQMDSLTEFSGLVDDKMIDFDFDLSSLVKTAVLDGGWQQLSPEIIILINYISDLVDDAPMLPLDCTTVDLVVDEEEADLDAICADLFYVCEHYNKPLHADEMAQVLYNVRKVEYYENPRVYPFSDAAFFKVVRNSDWPLNLDYPGNRLLAACGAFDEPDAKEKDSVNDNMILNIERVKLARTLRNVYEKKKNQSNH